MGHTDIAGSTSETQKQVKGMEQGHPALPLACCLPAERGGCLQGGDPEAVPGVAQVH